MAWSLSATVSAPRRVLTWLAVAPSRLSSRMRGRAATTSKRGEDALNTAYPEESPGPPPGGFFYCCACLTHGSRRTAALSDCTRTTSGVQRARSVQFTGARGVRYAGARGVLRAGARG